jgi:hypothetical protein
MKKHLKSMLAIMIAAFTFASCADVPSPYGLFFSDKGELEGAVGTGTADDPYNVAGAINFVRSLDPNVPTTNYVFIKGIVSRLVDGQNYDAGFGNGTFYISDDGNTKNEFYVFRALYFGSIPYTGGPVANVGDEVIICAKVINYNGNTPETVEKNGYLYSLNGATSYDMPEFGTKEAPLSVADAIDIINKLENKETAGFGYVKGKVSKVGDLTASSGKLTYYISDDGSNSKTIQVYMGLGLEKGKFKATTDLTIGDEVVVYGPLYKYANSSGAITPEINEGNYLIALTKGDGPVLPTNTIGSKENPITVESALDRIAQLDKDAQSELQAYIKGKVVSVITNDENAKKYHNLDYIISSDGKENGKTLKVFRGKGINGADFNANGDLKPGDEVVVLGFLYNYQGTTPEVNEGSILVSHTKGSGTTPDPQSDTPTIEGVTMTKSVNDLVVTFTNPNATAGSSVEYDLTTTSIAHQTENPSFTINGVQFAFAASGGSTKPKYWKTDLANEFRLYALNTLTITGTANIAKVTFQCTLHNGKNATGNEQSFAKVDGKKFVFKNDWTSTSSGTQCRISKVTITYAK